MRLANRLTLSFLAVIAIGAGSTLLLVRGATESVFRSYVFSGDADKAKAYATILGDWYAEHGSWEGIQAYLSGLPRTVYDTLNRELHGNAATPPVTAFSPETFGKLMADRVTLANGEGVIVADTAGKLLGTVHPPHHLALGIPVMADWKRVGTVLVGSMVDSSLSDVGTRFLGSISSSLLLATLLSGSLALLLGLLASRRITRRIAHLNLAVGRVAAGDTGARVEEGGGDEISQLAVSFNAMTAELGRLEEAKRRIIADSAHELRTPVTLIQGAVEAMIDGIFPADKANLESLHEETVRLSRLIDMLRELESLDSGALVLERTAIDPLETVRRTAGLFSHACREKDITIKAEGEEAPGASADPLRLDEILYNLVGNAVKQTPRGGTIRVAAGRGPGAGAFSITVEDSGPGIPVAERERIFERFYRLDRSRSRDSGGRGLGLAISQEIAKAHGGSISVSTSSLGGAAFVVTIPAARAGTD
jgi:two-component system OmpR family sensor kinase/two-component system sensor histidine kinase BaeS